jgi:integrative and conjugative element protein (TIGR02256 family)
MVAQSAEDNDPMIYREHKWFYKEHRFVLPESVNQQLNIFRQIDLDLALPESGGLILGRRITGTTDCITDEITSPMDGDIQKRALFFRGKWHHLRQIEYWRNTETTGQLLGTWHTHPETDPTPSDTDYRDWSMIVKKCSKFSQPLFFIIIGQSAFRVWVGINRRFRPTLFVQCEFQED